MSFILNKNKALLSNPADPLGGPGRLWQLAGAGVPLNNTSAIPLRWLGTHSVKDFWIATGMEMFGDPESISEKLNGGCEAIVTLGG